MKNGDYKNIQIYGDSRGRELWDAFKGVLSASAMKDGSGSTESQLSGPYYMNDGNWPATSFYNDRTNKITLRYDKFDSPDGVKEHFLKVYGNNTIISLEKSGAKFPKIPKIIIISEQVLHQLRDNDTETLYSKAEKILKFELLPFLKEITSKSNSLVIFYECEKVEVNNYNVLRSNVEQKNSYINKWNMLLRNLIPDVSGTKSTNFTNNRIFRISANLKTALSPIQNETLLTEGIHLAWKRVGEIVTPQSLLVDVSILLNLVCNRFYGEEYCCSGVL